MYLGKIQRTTLYVGSFLFSLHGRLRFNSGHQICTESSLPTNSSGESCIQTPCESLHCFSTKELCFMENESCVGILLNNLFDFVNRYSLIMSKEL